MKDKFYLGSIVYDRTAHHSVGILYIKKTLDESKVVCVSERDWSESIHDIKNLKSAYCDERSANQIFISEAHFLRNKKILVESKQLPSLLTESPIRRVVDAKPKIEPAPATPVPTPVPQQPKPVEVPKPIVQPDRPKGPTTPSVQPIEPIAPPIQAIKTEASAKFNIGDKVKDKAGAQYMVMGGEKASDRLLLRNLTTRERKVVMPDEIIKESIEHSAPGPAEPESIRIANLDDDDLGYYETDEQFQDFLKQNRVAIYGHELWAWEGDDEVIQAYAQDYNEPPEDESQLSESQIKELKHLSGLREDTETESPFTDEDAWKAIASAHGVDLKISETEDGDPKIILTQVKTGNWFDIGLEEVAEESNPAKKIEDLVKNFNKYYEMYVGQNIEEPNLDEEQISKESLTSLANNLKDKESKFQEILDNGDSYSLEFYHPYLKIGGEDDNDSNDYNVLKQITQEILPKLEKYGLNAKSINSEEKGYWSIDIPKSMVKETMEEKEGEWIDNCDNTDHQGEQGKVSQVKMKKEFGGGKAYWCDRCKERDKDMLAEEMAEETDMEESQIPPTCKHCGGDMMVIQHAAGKDYYACPKCDSDLIPNDDKDESQDLPKDMPPKGTGATSLEEEEVAEPCPKCGKPMFPTTTDDGEECFGCRHCKVRYPADFKSMPGIQTIESKSVAKPVSEPVSKPVVKGKNEAVVKTAGSKVVSQAKSKVCEHCASKGETAPDIQTSVASLHSAPLSEAKVVHSDTFNLKESIKSLGEMKESPTLARMSREEAIEALDSLNTADEPQSFGFISMDAPPYTGYYLIDLHSKKIVNKYGRHIAEMPPKGSYTWQSKYTTDVDEGVLKEAENYGKLIATNTSRWGWEYDADEVKAYVFSDGVNLQLIIINTHTKSGLGAGETRKQLENLPIGTVEHPALSQVKSILKQHGHSKSAAGHGFSMLWTDTQGNKAPLSQIIKGGQPAPEGATKTPSISLAAKDETATYDDIKGGKAPEQIVKESVDKPVDNCPSTSYNPPYVNSEAVDNFVDNWKKGVIAKLEENTVAEGIVASDGSPAANSQSSQSNQSIQNTQSNQSINESDLQCPKCGETADTLDWQQVEQGPDGRIVRSVCPHCGYEESEGEDTVANDACPECGGPLEYDPDTMTQHCPECGLGWGGPSESETLEGQRDIARKGQKCPECGSKEQDKEGPPGDTYCKKCGALVGSTPDKGFKTEQLKEGEYAKCDYCGLEMKPNNKGCWKYFIDNAGTYWERIPYGGEGEDTDMPCGDCNVTGGGYHHDGCDNEHCPKCGDQAAFCECWKAVSNVLPAGKKAKLYEGGDGTEEGAKLPPKEPIPTKDETMTYDDVTKGKAPDEIVEEATVAELEKCPKCGSTEVHLKHNPDTQLGNPHEWYECEECGYKMESKNEDYTSDLIDLLNKPEKEHTKQDKANMKQLKKVLKLKIPKETKVEEDEIDLEIGKKKPDGTYDEAFYLVTVEYDYSEDYTPKKPDEYSGGQWYPGDPATRDIDLDYADIQEISFYEDEAQEKYVELKKGMPGFDELAKQLQAEVEDKLYQHIEDYEEPREYEPDFDDRDDECNIHEDFKHLAGLNEAIDYIESMFNNVLLKRVVDGQIKKADIDRTVDYISKVFGDDPKEVRTRIESMLYAEKVMPVDNVYPEQLPPDMPPIDEMLGKYQKPIVEEEKPITYRLRGFPVMIKRAGDKWEAYVNAEKVGEYDTQDNAELGAGWATLEMRKKAGLDKGIEEGVADEFKVGDVLDPQGNTNMVGQVKIREITGNTIKFTDSEGTDYAGMQRAQVRRLIDAGSWKRVVSGLNESINPTETITLRDGTQIEVELSIDYDRDPEGGVYYIEDYSILGDTTLDGVQMQELEDKIAKLDVLDYLRDIPEPYDNEDDIEPEPEPISLPPEVLTPAGETPDTTDWTEESKNEKEGHPGMSISPEDAQEHLKNVFVVVGEDEYDQHTEVEDYLLELGFEATGSGAGSAEYIGKYKSAEDLMRLLEKHWDGIGHFVDATDDYGKIKRYLGEEFNPTEFGDVEDTAKEPYDLEHKPVSSYNEIAKLSSEYDKVFTEDPKFQAFAEKLIQIDNEVWDELNIDSGSQLHASAELEAKYSEALKAKLAEAGIQAGGVYGAYYFELENQNYHSLNQFLLDNGYFYTLDVKKYIEEDTKPDKETIEKLAGKVDTKDLVSLGAAALIGMMAYKLGKKFIKSVGPDVKPLEEAVNEKYIDIFRRIVANKQHEKVEGKIVDLFTASRAVQIYDALSPQAQAKFDTLPLDKLISIIYKIGEGKQFEATDFAMPTPQQDKLGEGKLVKGSVVTFKGKKGKVIDTMVDKGGDQPIPMVHIQFDDGRLSWEVADDANMNETVEAEPDLKKYAVNADVQVFASHKGEVESKLQELIGAEEFNVNDVWEEDGGVYTANVDLYVRAYSNDNAVKTAEDMISGKAWVGYADLMEDMSETKEIPTIQDIDRMIDKELDRIEQEMEINPNWQPTKKDLLVKSIANKLADRHEGVATEFSDEEMAYLTGMSRMGMHKAVRKAYGKVRRSPAGRELAKYGVDDEIAEDFGKLSGTPVKEEYLGRKELHLKMDLDKELDRIEASLNNPNYTPTKRDLNIIELAKKILDNQPLSDAEISMLTGISRMGVNKIVRRSLGKLRKEIETNPEYQELLPEKLKRITEAMKSYNQPVIRVGSWVNYNGENWHVESVEDDMLYISNKDGKEEYVSREAVDFLTEYVEQTPSVMRTQGGLYEGTPIFRSKGFKIMKGVEGFNILNPEGDIVNSADTQEHAFELLGMALRDAGLFEQSDADYHLAGRAVIAYQEKGTEEPMSDFIAIWSKEQGLPPETVDTIAKLADEIVADYSKIDEDEAVKCPKCGDSMDYDEDAYTKGINQFKCPSCGYIEKKEESSINEMRSIGVKYRNLLKRLVQAEIDRQMKVHPWTTSLDYAEAEDNIKAQIPDEVYDTWESAWSEVDRLIGDMLTSYSHKGSIIEGDEARPCPCGSGLDSYWQKDARGIPLGRTCAKCHDKKMKSFRPEVLTDPDYETDEPVEPEEYYESKKMDESIYSDYCKLSGMRLEKVFEMQKDTYDRLRSQYKDQADFVVKSLGDYITKLKINAFNFITKLRESGVPLDKIMVNDWESSTAIKVFVGGKEFKRFSDFDLRRALKFAGVKSSLRREEVKKSEAEETCPKCGSNKVVSFAEEGDTLMKCKACGYTVENGVVVNKGGKITKEQLTNLKGIDGAPKLASGSVVREKKAKKEEIGRLNDQASPECCTIEEDAVPIQQNDKVSVAGVPTQDQMAGFNGQQGMVIKVEPDGVTVKFQDGKDAKFMQPMYLKKLGAVPQQQTPTPPTQITQSTNI